MVVVGSRVIKAPVFIDAVPLRLFSQIPEFIRESSESDGTGHGALDHLFVTVRLQGGNFTAADKLQGGIDLGIGKVGQLFYECFITDGRGSGSQREVAPDGKAHATEHTQRIVGVLQIQSFKTLCTEDLFPVFAAQTLHIAAQHIFSRNAAVGKDCPKGGACFKGDGGKFFSGVDTGMVEVAPGIGFPGFLPERAVKQIPRGTEKGVLHEIFVVFGSLTHLVIDAGVLRNKTQHLCRKGVLRGGVDIQ